MLTIVTAMPWEAGAFIARLRARRRIDAGEGWAIQGDHGNVAMRVLISGPGPARVRRAAEALAGMEPRSTGILAAGVAGGLDPRVRPGDLVLAQRIVRRYATGGHGATRLATDDTLRGFIAARLRHQGIAHQEGTLLSTDRILATTVEKAEQARNTQALAVQMEDAEWAEAAAAMGVPMVSLRAVLDAATTTVPRGIDGWIWTGPNVRDFARTLVRAPWTFAALPRLGWQRRQATRALDRALEAIVAPVPAGAAR